MDDSLPAAGALPFEHTYAALPAKFWQRVDPTPVKAPRLLAFNDALAAELGITRGDDAADVFAGNKVPVGALPLAMAYAGHQFGHFVPQLGDGRAILLGELIDRHGQRRDLQLKGAGPTAFSRNGDGRAAIGPVLREFLISEAMHAMGLPTTRSLAAVATGEHVFREGPVPGAVLARGAASHVRGGTLQFLAARRATDGVRQLADYVIARHYPEAAHAPRPYLALLEAVARRQAALVAQWQHVGFIHGVMNTDNTTLSGETIDYGPCAFLDDYDPGKVFSSIDRAGRYSFSNQPALVRWNVARLAETLLALIDADGEVALAEASAVIEAMPAWSEASWLDGMRAKLGLSSAEDGDQALAQDLLEAMRAVAADYTLVFRALAEAAQGREPEGLLALPRSPAFDAWRARWRHRLASDPRTAAVRAAAMRMANPAVIPRNHRVHEALVAAEQGDLAPFEALLAAIRRPWDDTPASRPFMVPPEPGQRVLQTFCGT
ncbi:MAG: YdiU family protein [Arenimonas sp.]|uniref:protein adenylyltransferase SelO n=1 Tax=Arenimonas sp. TaxID=1872635 RepID=UPI0025C258F9|nr:YdiU family protein [Arenimonas sp.]MBW8369047.1 YdiU family protein [Arenimonas sp.]